MTKRIRFCNDIHLEFSNFDMDFPYNGEDFLVLAGDITVKNEVDWILKQSKKFPHVIYIDGNHEHYQGRIDKVQRNNEAIFCAYPNIHYGNNISITVDGVTFHLSTLWSDFDHANPLTIMAAEGAMNDYKMIKYKNGENYHKFGPRDALREFQVAKLFLMDNVKEGDVVVTHMAPSFLSIAEEFKSDKLNGAFASDLTDLMLDKKPSFWCHGHVHNTCDYMVGDTRVLCNPRGYYPNDLNPDFDINAFFEI